VAPAELTGILLVGGASRRFGSPKALATFDGQILAERAWHTLNRACATCVAVGKQADALPLPFALVDDASAVRAALVGIVAGLRAAHTDLAVVLPVDVPLVRAGDLHRLAEACADVAVPQTGPLPCAIRCAAALPTLERRLAAESLALRDAFAELDTRTVEIDPETLANINTPTDLEALEAGIEPFRPEHADGFRALVSDTLREYGFTPDATLDPDLADPEGVYEALWVVLVGGEVVGSVALRQLGAGEFELKRMYLRPRLRGRGVGGKLLAIALDYARGHGGRTIKLDTTEEMAAARQLYEAHGFVRIPGEAPRQDQRRLLYKLELHA
jgi:molybdopterin-guanine dinucleotide biosynthesis protein A